jgi:peptidyl-tRNA hydrolase, PTH2 family
MKLKQVILVRTDIKMSKGKVGAQCAHASVEAVLKALKSKSGEEKVKSWRGEGMMKITLKIDSEKELYKYMQQAKDLGMITATITDAGHTFVAPGTVTCGCIGPDEIEKIDEITGKLKIL